MARRPSNYGAIIERARLRKGLTLRQLAERAGMDHSFLSRLERGETRDLGLSRAVTLCEILGLSLNELAGLRRQR